MWVSLFSSSSLSLSLSLSLSHIAYFLPVHLIAMRGSANQFFLFVLFILSFFRSKASSACYHSIISFGDSLADTGNLLYSQRNKPSMIGRLPYGETFFHHPTGRFTDGRLIIDFFAEEFGIPFLPPYLPHSGDDNFSFSSGVNFAVGGATALESDFFAKRGIIRKTTNNSLADQLHWFKQLLPRLCPHPSNCQERFRNTLFMVGEIGGNDYNYPFFQGWTIEQVTTFVPQVVAAIESAISTLIDHGATTLVVPGDFPIGCIAIYLTLFENSRAAEYDPQTRCLIRLNQFSEYHNQEILTMLDRLHKLHPHATILYADYYNNAIGLYDKMGFEGGTLKACCGGGGPYNYNSSATCGNSGAKVCDDPSSYTNWDGIHLTEAAYKLIAKGLIKELHYEIPPMYII